MPLRSRRMPHHHQMDNVAHGGRLTGHKRERDSSASDHNDGATYVKLFVGSVPRNITEDQVRPMFEEYGDVLEVAIIKDKRTGQQQGCCFVKYSSRDEADRAIRCLNNVRTLPGGSSAVQVRYADGERERLGAVEHKLFVGCLNKQANEQDVEEIFGPYGRVDDVYIMRDEQKQSRGCAFVKYPSREMAQAAIAALNNVYIMRGCDQPLAVRFADPKRPKTGDSRGGFSPRHGSGSGFHRSSGGSQHSGRASPISWRQSNAIGVRNIHQSGGGGPPPFPPPVIPRVSPSQAGSPVGLHGQFNSIPPQSPYNVQSQLVHTSGSGGIPAASSQQELYHTTVQRPAQSFGQQAAVQQFVQLAQQHAHPYQLQQQQQQQQPQISPLHLQPTQQQFSPQPPQQSFPQLHLTQQLPSIQQQLAQPPSLQHNQPQILQNQQLPLQNISQQPQVLQPSALSQQASWLLSAPTQLVQSLVPPPVLPVAPTCNWTEHISPEGYKYYYNSVTSESKWEKPDELLKVEQQQAPPPPELNLPQFQPANGSLDQLRQQVWI